jgi:hypothetical protein
MLGDVIAAYTPTSCTTAGPSTDLENANSIARLASLLQNSPYWRKQLVDMMKSSQGFEPNLPEWQTLLNPVGDNEKNLSDTDLEDLDEELAVAELTQIQKRKTLSSDSEDGIDVPKPPKKKRNTVRNRKNKRSKLITSSDEGEDAASKCSPDMQNARILSLPKDNESEKNISAKKGKRSKDKSKVGVKTDVRVKVTKNIQTKPGLVTKLTAKSPLSESSDGDDNELEKLRNIIADKKKTDTGKTSFPTGMRNPRAQKGEDKGKVPIF